MKIEDTSLITLETKLLIWESRAISYSSNLSTLYYDLYMKSFDKKDTVEINLDNIKAERTLVDEELNTLKTLNKALPWMNRIIKLNTRLIELGESDLVNKLSKEYPFPDITPLADKYSDDKQLDARIKELKRGAVKKVEKPKVVPRMPEPIQKKTSIKPPTEFPMQKKIKWRESSLIFDIEGKLKKKGDVYLELYEKAKQVFSQYCHYFIDVEKISYFIVLAMEDKVNETHLYETLQMHNGYMKSPYMYASQMITTSVKRADKMTSSLDELYGQYKDALRNTTLRDWIMQKASEGTFTAWRELLFWLLEKSYALPHSFGYYCYDYEEDFIHHNKVHHLDANDDACNVTAMRMLPLYSEYLRLMGLTDLADKTAQAFCTEPMYFVCKVKSDNGNYIFSNPWHEEMEVSSEGINNGDAIVSKCVYTSLVHFDGLYYVNTELYPKTKAVYTKWANTLI